MHDSTHLRREEDAESQVLIKKDTHRHPETARELLDRIKHIGDLIQNVINHAIFEI